MSEITLTHVGGPTMLIEAAGWRILTDPTFDPPGKRYFFGWGTVSRKLAGPALSPAEIGPVDAILLSHDHHQDNLDPAGRALLPGAGTVLTTESGAGRLASANVRGLAPWGTTRLQAPGKVPIEVTATPCRHGPPGSHPIVGDVIGFALGWEGQQNGQLWISGDTVLYDGVRQVPKRLPVGASVLHLGGVTFPWLSGNLRYTLTAEAAVELIGLLPPGPVVPIHYEGWKHFRQGRGEAQRVFGAAPGVADRVQWVELGRPATLTV